MAEAEAQKKDPPKTDVKLPPDGSEKATSKTAKSRTTKPKGIVRRFPQKGDAARARDEGAARKEEEKVEDGKPEEKKPEERKEEKREAAPTAAKPPATPEGPPRQNPMQKSPVKPPPRPTSVSPFRPAAKRERRVKLFVFGDTGTMKTRVALQFPKPCVIDLEKGTDQYANEFNFDVLPTTGCDGVLEAVEWLGKHEHDYRTLVIDPITEYWVALQHKWTSLYHKREVGGPGHKTDYYVLQPRDWVPLKNELRNLRRAILALDMNVVVTAHERPEYAEGSFMRRIGETFDSERGLPYMFDIVVQFKVENNKHVARVVKDRTGKLPAEFATSYATFGKTFAGDAITRPARPAQNATAEQLERIRLAIGQLGLDHARVAQRLEDYGADRVEDLTLENAALILERLEAAVEAKVKKEGTDK